MKQKRPSRRGKAVPRFKIGDRVTERDRLNLAISPKSSEARKEFNDRKVGVVEEIFKKTAKNGYEYFFVKVHWINSSHRSVHSQMRLIPVEDAG